jgi:exo-beta-1,3-glucanase (GH17 family)
MKFVFLIIGLVLFSNCAALQSLNSISTSSNTASASLNSISSVSDSVKSISTSVSNVFQSISDSSKTTKSSTSQIYKYDIAVITEFKIKNHSTETNFIQEIEKIAFKNQVKDWKLNLSTYEGIGLGLKKANLTKEEFNSFKETIANQKAEFIQALEKGFHS